MAETILVVDDDANNRELLEAILTDGGYLVAQAENGLGALAQATASPPDLILLDLMMPEMSGVEVCRRLKQGPVTAGVPIIVVTALGQIKDKEAVLTSGADDFVTKPVQAEDLRARVSAMLRVRCIRQDLDRTLAYLHELDATRHAQRRTTLASVLAGTPPAPPPTSTMLPILLVDDEALTRKFYGDLLTEHGFQGFTAKDGPEGLELAGRHHVEAVILDIMMPGMSGLEVLERLHSQDPDLPVIILTAYPSSEHAIAALKLGAFDFIVKGLGDELVLLAVHRAVRHRREVFAKREEVAQLRSRIAELEATRPGAVA
ncbi:MAG: response regulator [Candidatus Methylomirabilota bacterium]|jgi:two-component system cell cycle response regulator